MSKQVIIVHGSYGTSQENWFPWLARQVRDLGHRAVTPDFPTPDGQSLQSWVDVFNRDVGKLSPDVVLVGHSLGAAFILRLLERTRQPISGTFLVSGFLGELGLPDFDKVNADFVTAPVKWQTVRENAGIARVFNGDNDPYVPIERGREISAELGVDLTVVHGGGHLNAAAGFTTFPQLLDDIRRLCLE